MDQTREKDLMEIRRVVHEEIENFVKTTEQKITDAGFTPFEVGFTAVRDEKSSNDFDCAWDIGLDFLRGRDREDRKPLPWINSEKYGDYPNIRTNHDALRAASNLGPYVGFQVNILEMLYDMFSDEIWPELEDSSQERFSTMTLILQNCIDKLQEHADEIERLPQILCRNQQRIVLGMDKEKAA